MLHLPYKKLLIWQKGIRIAKKTYELTNQFPKKEQWKLAQQMQAAAVSISSNIAEGSQRTTNKDFANFISIARGSLAELETQWIIAEDLHYIDQAQYSQIMTDIEELSKMIRSFHMKLITNH